MSLLVVLSGLLFFRQLKPRKSLEQFYGQSVTVKELDLKKPHPNAKHSVLVDHVRAVLTKAIETYKEMELLYCFRDHEFKHWFKAIKTERRENGAAKQYKMNYKLDPDGLVGFQLGQLPASNFCVEVLRSAARVPKDPKHLKDSLRKKYEGIYYNFVNGEWRKWTKKYPQIKNPKNTRMLTICDYKEQEFENLLEVIRKIDETGKGYRGFYFIRLADFERIISVEKKVQLKSGKIISQRWYTDDSVMRLWDPIWRTPRDKDNLESILS